MAQGLFYGLATWICVVGAIQVTRQVFFSAERPHPYPSCREGLRALAAAVDRARRTAPGLEGVEEVAIARFRRSLEPEWSFRDNVASACRGRAEDEGALDTIERLRYAEEHAVRREAGDLAPLRRRVQTIVDEQLGPATDPKGPSRPHADPR
jgi:hypothetical protein